MAISFIAATQGFSNTATVLTVDHDIAAGTDRVLVVGVGVKTIIPTVSVTWNGTSMTQALVRNAFSVRVGLWYLTNPDTGSHSLVVTISTSAAGSAVCCVAANLIGATQAAPAITASNSGGGGTILSVSTSIATGGSFFFDAGAISRTNQTLTAGAEQIVLGTVNGSNSFGMSYQSSNDPVALTNQWTSPTAQTWASVGIVIAPVPDSGGGGAVTGIMNPKSQYWGDL